MAKDTQRQVGLWVITGLVAATFVITGGSKLANVPPSPENFARWGFSLAFMHAIGAIELAGGLALLIPSAATLAAMVLIGTMVGAIRTGVLSGEPMHIALPLVLIGLLAVVAIRRRQCLLTLFRRRGY